MVLLSGQIHADEVKIDVPFELLELVGDVEYGEYLASDCKTFHTADGESGGNLINLLNLNAKEGK